MVIMVFMSLLIFQHCYAIISEFNSCFGLEVFGIFFTNFDMPTGCSLFSVLSLVVQNSFQMCLENVSTITLCPEFLYGVKA